MKTEHEDHGAFTGRVKFQVYQSNDGQVSVFENHSKFNPNLAYVLTDFYLAVTCSSKEKCKEYQSKIRKISKSYEIDDTIEEIHKIELNIK
jgi:hypothetical protein